MAFQVIVRNRATQDIRQQANYILVNGNRESGEKFLEFVEYTFMVANGDNGNARIF